MMLRVAALYNNRRVSGSSIVLEVLKLLISVHCALPGRGTSTSIRLGYDHRRRSILSCWTYRQRSVVHPKGIGIYS